MLFRHNHELSPCSSLHSAPKPGSPCFVDVPLTSLTRCFLFCRLNLVTQCGSSQTRQLCCSYRPASLVPFPTHPAINPTQGPGCACSSISICPFPLLTFSSQLQLGFSYFGFWAVASPTVQTQTLWGVYPGRKGLGQNSPEFPCSLHPKSLRGTY